MGICSMDTLRGKCVFYSFYWIFFDDFTFIQSSIYFCFTLPFLLFFSLTLDAKMPPSLPHYHTAFFTRSFYKHLLGVPIEYSDIEGVDPDYYKSLSQILDYNLEDIGLELTFSADVQTFGRNEVCSFIYLCV